MTGDADFLDAPDIVGRRRPVALFWGSRLMPDGSKVVDVDVLTLLVAAARLGSRAGANREELDVGTGDCTVLSS